MEKAVEQLTFCRANAKQPRSKNSSQQKLKEALRPPFQWQILQLHEFKQLQNSQWNLHSIWFTAGQGTCCAAPIFRCLITCIRNEGQENGQLDHDIGGWGDASSLKVSKSQQPAKERRSCKRELQPFSSQGQMICIIWFKNYRNFHPQTLACFATQVYPAFVVLTWNSCDIIWGRMHICIEFVGSSSHWAHQYRVECHIVKHIIQYKVSWHDTLD